MTQTVFNLITTLFMIYFMFLYGIYMILNLLSAISLTRYLRVRNYSASPQTFNGLELPITIIVPAYNEETTISDSIHALLQLNYPEYEIVVVNDGSKDGTLATMIEEFGLVEFPEAYRVQIQTEPVKGVYHSTRYRNLRLIDKENGGKADSLNAGINSSRYPLFCGVDADSVLQSDSLLRVVQPFLDDPRTVASGGTIRIANGCDVQEGQLLSAGLPSHPLALIQVTEYLRAFLFGRLGWSILRCMLIISGAFGLFHKETVIRLGGYRTDTIGEDMELIVNMHKTLKLEGRDYQITFMPDPVCWTEAPEDLKTLKTQRVRWQQGLAESLMSHRKLLFNRKGGTPGWLAMPYMIVFELFGPVIEISSLLFVAVGSMAGLIDPMYALAYVIIAVGLGSLISVIALLLEEISFHIYPRFRDLFVLFIAALVENLGYRQLNSWWRLLGLMRWIRGKNSSWGEMKRIGRK